MKDSSVSVCLHCWVGCSVGVGRWSGPEVSLFVSSAPPIPSKKWTKITQQFWQLLIEKSALNNRYKKPFGVFARNRRRFWEEDLGKDSSRSRDGEEGSGPNPTGGEDFPDNEKVKVRSWRWDKK